MFARHPVDDHAQECLMLVLIGIMAAVLKHLQFAAFESLAESLGILHEQQLVLQKKISCSSQLLTVKKTRVVNTHLSRSKNCSKVAKKQVGHLFSCLQHSTHTAMQNA